MKKSIPLFIFLLALLLLQSSWRLQLLFNPIATEQLADDDIILYSTRWCPYCVKTRRFFRAAEIPFTDRDIESSTQHYQQYEKLGGNGVPLIKIGSSLVQGYDPDAIRAAIEQLQEKP